MNDTDQARLDRSEMADDVLFDDEDPTDPGPWITAGFGSPCAHGDMIDEGDTIRATGDGEWEHQECVTEFGRPADPAHRFVPEPGPWNEIR